MPAKPGEIRSFEKPNRVLGKHDGLMFYTLGKRKGLGIGGSEGTGEPWFVVDKDLKENILYVVQGDNHPALYSHGLFAEDINWIAGKPPKDTFSCTAKFRYRQPDQSVKVATLGSDASCEVIFDIPQRAVTPGQFVVFYQNEECLGGGVIETVFKDQTAKLVP